MARLERGLAPLNALLMAFSARQEGCVGSPSSGGSNPRFTIASPSGLNLHKRSEDYVILLLVATSWCIQRLQAEFPADCVDSMR